MCLSCFSIGTAVGSGGDSGESKNTVYRNSHRSNIRLLITVDVCRDASRYLRYILFLAQTYVTACGKCSCGIANNIIFCFNLFCLHFTFEDRPFDKKCLSSSLYETTSILPLPVLGRSTLQDTILHIET